MAGWELMPSGSTEILSCEGVDYREHKLIGYWKLYRTNKDGELIGLVSQDGVQMEITREKINVLGYEKPWQAARRMYGPSRKDCAAWVYQLVKEGKFEHHRKAE